jgi:hypothetical protein
MKDIARDKCLIHFGLLLAGFLLIFAVGCDNDSSNPITYLNEHDFAQDPSIVSTTNDLVIINLEHPDATDVHEYDSHITGVDRIPLYFANESNNHEFILEHKGDWDEYYMVLLDEEDNEILRLDRDTPIVTDNIPAGTYTLEIYHGSGIGDDYTLFIRPGSTYISGNCPECDLRYAPLSHANLSEANLVDVDFTGAFLPYADLSGAYLRRANFRGADLRNADLSGAVFPGAYLGGADLSGANVSNADLQGANLSNAVWINNEICKTCSICECLQ